MFDLAPSPKGYFTNKNTYKAEKLTINTEINRESIALTSKEDIN